MKKFDISDIWPEWELTGSIGKGPFGEVFLSKNETENKDIKWSAIKIITVPRETYNEEVASGKRNAINFAKYQNDLTWEMTMFKALNSPGLIKPDEMTLRRNRNDTGWVCAVRTNVYTPLEEYFGKRICTSDVIRMGREICTSLINCSNLGMVHGDIKPENILVNDDGKFLLSDFGIKKCLDTAGIADKNFYTHDYDSPEVENEHRFFHVSDIYSLGMSMAYILNNYSVPIGKNINLINCDNTELIKIIKKAVAYDPMERYNSASDMLNALDRLKVPEKYNVKKVDSLSKAQKKAKKNVCKADDTENSDVRKQGKFFKLLHKLKNF